MSNRNGRGYSHGNGRVYKVAIETYIYYHTQCGGYQARKIKFKDGYRIYDVSKYFGVTRYGSLRGAAIAAREWKNRHLTSRAFR